MDKWFVFMFSGVLAISQQENFVKIGEHCQPGSDDIDILGGKRSHFFLRCVSKDGMGTWVIKHKSIEIQKNHIAIKKKKVHVCAKNFTIKETQECDTSSICLQPAHDENSYLECDLHYHVWIKKYCTPGLRFNFDLQTCIGQKRHVARQSLNGIACTYTGCVNSNQCSRGSCNSGYCCHRSNSGTSIIICPNGGTPSGSCYNGVCSSGYTCSSNNLCCSSGINYNGYSSCPNGYYSSGTCSNNNQCSSGCSCFSNTCCCIQGSICPDGTQAVGACVNGQCGIGFTCTNGLCCSSAFLTYRCLDGSDAIGFCINCACGGNYYCTTGNLCCPLFTSVCPTGTTSIGPCVNGICPTGFTCFGTGINQQCCGMVSSVTCLAIDSNGPCINNACTAGFTCDTTNQQCCPNLGDVVGPCLNGGCQPGAYCLQSDQQCYNLLT